MNWHLISPSTKYDGPNIVVVELFFLGGLIQSPGFVLDTSFFRFSCTSRSEFEFKNQPEYQKAPRETKALLSL